MSEHKFKIGQSGPLHVRSLWSRRRSSGVYKIMQLLPPEGDDRQYRIKSASEPHERVVKESQLNGVGYVTMKGRLNRDEKFDYGMPAELFMAKRKGGARQPLGYRRFARRRRRSASPVEDFPAMRTLGAWLQVGDERFDGDDIHRLYDSGEFPLERRMPS